MIERMRREDIRIDIVQMESGPRLKISFRYRDKSKAERTVRTLMTHLMDANYNTQFGLPTASVFRTGTMDVLDPPSLPMMSAFGIRQYYRPTPQGVALLAILFGLAGIVLAGLARLFVKAWRFRYLTIGLGAAGAVTGVYLGMTEPALVSLLPWSYVSRADLQIILPRTGTEPTAALEQQATALFMKMQRDVLSTSSLWSIIADPRLALYQKERRSSPSDKVVEHMRRDIGVTLGHGSATPIVSLSFRYRDRFKAQQVIQSLVTRFLEAYRRNEPQPVAATAIIPANLDVLNAPGPGLPFKPNRYAELAIGLGGGVLAAALTKLILKARTLRTAV